MSSRLKHNVFQPSLLLLPLLCLILFSGGASRSAAKARKIENNPYYNPTVAEMELLDELTAGMPSEEKANAVLFLQDGRIVAYSQTVANEWTRYAYVGNGVFLNGTTQETSVEAIPIDDVIPDPDTTGSTSGTSTGTTSSSTGTTSTTTGTTSTTTGTTSTTTGTTSSTGSTTATTTGSTTGTTGETTGTSTSTTGSTSTSGSTTGTTTGTSTGTSGSTTGETSTTGSTGQTSGSTGTTTTGGSTTGGGDPCLACMVGQSGTSRADPFGGSGPYRRVKVRSGLHVQGVKATVHALGFLPDIAPESQPVAPASLFSDLRSNPYIYFSANPGQGGYDIGYQVGFLSPSVAVLKRFASVNGFGWRGSANLPLPSWTTMTLQVVSGKGKKHLKFRGEYNTTMFIEGEGADGNWTDNNEIYGFCTSIAFPKDDTTGYHAPQSSTDPDKRPWYCEVVWTNRQVFSEGSWHDFTGNYLLNIGNYPQTGEGLQSNDVNNVPTGEQYAGPEAPVYIEGYDGPWNVANEKIAIDLRRPFRGN